MDTVDDPGRGYRTAGAGSDAGAGSEAGAADGAGASEAAASSSPSDRPGISAVTTASTGSAGSGLVFDDPLSRPSADDSDRGWGDSASPSAEDDFSRFLNEKPPHHL